MEATIALQDLPPDMLGVILGFCEIYDLPNVARVCNNWRRVTMIPWVVDSMMQETAQASKSSSGLGINGMRLDLLRKKCTIGKNRMAKRLLLECARRDDLDLLLRSRLVINEATMLENQIDFGGTGYITPLDEVMRSRAGKILSAIIDSWSPPSPDPSSSSSVSSGTPARSPAMCLPKVPPYLEKVLDKVALHWQQTIGQLCTQSETDPIDEFGLLILGLIKNNRLIFWKSFLGNSNMHSPGNTRSFALFQRYPFNLDLNEDLGDGIRPHYFVTIAIQIVRFLECSVAVGAPDSQGRSIWSYSCSPASSADLKDILIALSSTLHLRYPPNLISEILSDSSTWNFSRVCALLDRCVFLASFLSKYPYTITQQDIDAIAQLGQSEVVTAMHLFCPTSKQPRAVEERDLCGKVFVGNFNQSRTRIEFGPIGTRTYRGVFTSSRDATQVCEVRETWKLVEPLSITECDDQCISSLALETDGVTMQQSHGLFVLSGGVMRTNYMNRYGAFFGHDGKLWLICMSEGNNFISIGKDKLPRTAIASAFLKARQGLAALLREVDTTEEGHM